MGRGRRSASPRPAFRASAPPAAPASRLPSRVPQKPQQVMQPPAAQPRQPGLFANMASTAAGVAIGSSVGHAIGAAMTGGGENGAPQQQEAMAPAYGGELAQPGTGIPGSAGAGGLNQDQLRSPCAYELEQFLRCTNTQSDLTLCSGFNEALKECRTRFGI